MREDKITSLPIYFNRPTKKKNSDAVRYGWALFFHRQDYYIANVRYAVLANHKTKTIEVYRFNKKRKHEGVLRTFAMKSYENFDGGNMKDFVKKYFAQEFIDAKKNTLKQKRKQT